MSFWLRDLRYDLHRHPELAGHEEATAFRLKRIAETLHPSRILEDLGGHGQAWIFQGEAPGPTVLLRADMDATPVRDEGDHTHRSSVEGVSHACGHDGHMAILAGVSERLSEQPVPNGRVVCLFQPAEENGTGAKAVLRDPRFAELRPDVAFALHNLPGFGFGDIIVRSGTCCCASRGMSIRLGGIPAHAAYPEAGRSPLRAMRRILKAFEGLASEPDSERELTLLTVVGARLGAKAFGTTPADAEVFATLRSESNAAMEDLIRAAESIVASNADEDSLSHTIGYEDVFPATVNTERAVDLVRWAAESRIRLEPRNAFRWSEDFGHFTAAYGGALVALGAGEKTLPLHHPGYDFPDSLIPHGIDLLLRIVDRALTSPSPKS